MQSEEMEVRVESGHCEAGERCSCPATGDSRTKCNLWKRDDQPTKVFGLLAVHPEQKPLIEKHCFGDCGKISLGGVIADAATGGLMVCCEIKCPWLKAEMDEPYGNTMSFGRPHEVYLRSLTDTPVGSTQTTVPA